MSISVFLSTVTDEFGAYRVKLEGDLTRHDVAVKVQERFKDLGGDTLDKLDIYVAHCDAVVASRRRDVRRRSRRRPAGSAGRQISRSPAAPAAARRRARRRRGDSLYPLGGLARALPQEAAHDREGGAGRAARAEARADRWLARFASGASRAAQGGSPLSRLRVRESRRSRQAYRLFGDPRSAGQGLCREDGARARRRRGLHQGNGQARRGRQGARFRRHETGGRERHRDLRKGDRRTAGRDQSRRHRRPRFGEGEGTGRQRSVTPRPRHPAQGRRGDEARGGRAPRALCRWGHGASQQRARHCAGVLRRRSCGRRNLGAGRGHSRGERGGGRDLPEVGSEDALRIWQGSRQQRASCRCDRVEARKFWR